MTGYTFDPSLPRGENADEKPETCSACEWPTEDLNYFQPARGTNAVEGCWLCLVCRNTFSGNSRQYPAQYPDMRILQMTAWQTNYLASVIRGDTPSL